MSSPILELIDSAAPAEWKTVFCKLYLVGNPQCLLLLDKEVPCADVGLKSETDSF